MIGAFFTFIKVLPELIKLIREIFGKVQEAKTQAEKKNLAKAIHEGMQDARIKKDTSKLEAIFRGNV